jgi:hypothetical protein
MMCNHEAVAIMLSTDMEARNTMEQSGTFLDIACEFRFVQLVEVLLGRGDRKCTHEESVGNITNALHNLLTDSSCSGVQHDTESMERVEKIVTEQKSMRRLGDVLRKNLCPAIQVSCLAT